MTYPNGTKVSVRNTPNVTDGECGIVEGYSHCASLLRVNFGSRTVFCSHDNCTAIDFMTQDEKIKEVMELVSKVVEWEFKADKASKRSTEHLAKSNSQDYRNAIESKLRQLIR